MQHDHLYSIYFIPPGSLSFRLYNLPLARTHPLRRPLVNSTHASRLFPPIRMSPYDLTFSPSKDH
jgi:hypothetical protein